MTAMAIVPVGWNFEVIATAAGNQDPEARSARWVNGKSQWLFVDGVSQEALNAAIGEYVHVPEDVVGIPDPNERVLQLEERVGILEAAVTKMVPTLEVWGA